MRRVAVVGVCVLLACADGGTDAEDGGDPTSGEMTSSGTETNPSTTDAPSSSSQTMSSSSDTQTSGDDMTGPTTQSESDSGSSETSGDPPGEAELEGYGTLSSFGAGGDTCTVTNLDDTGPGSLHDCVTNRDTTDDNPTPRVVDFEVGGTIVSTTTIRIRQPYLTVDGLSAPDPGITLEKTGDGTSGGMTIQTWPPNTTCGHDVLVQGLRVRGVWTHQSEDHNQNTPTIALDGEDLTECLSNVVLNRVTLIDAQDSAGDIWGSASDVTVQYSAFLYSLHPNTYSHSPGGEPNQQRERISNHHNLYAYIHERGPQVRGDNRDSNFEQNIMHRWAAFGFGGGYAMRLRCRDGSCPQRLNVIANHFTSGGANANAAVILGEQAGPDGDDATIAPQVFMQDNRLTPENQDVGSAANEFPRDPEADVTIYPPDELVSSVLPNIGVPFRTDEEDTIFAEVADQVESDLGL